MSKRIMILSLFFVLSACSKPPFLYRPDISQGNIISSEAVKQLQVGMSKIQVHALLGNPLLQDPFHPELDSYVYSLTSGKTGQITRRSLAISYDKTGNVTQIKEVPLTTK